MWIVSFYVVELLKLGVLAWNLMWCRSFYVVELFDLGGFGWILMVGSFEIVSYYKIVGVKGLKIWFGPSFYVVELFKLGDFGWIWWLVRLKSLVKVKLVVWKGLFLWFQVLFGGFSGGVPGGVGIVFLFHEEGGRVGKCAGRWGVPGVPCPGWTKLTGIFLFMFSLGV